MKMCENETSFQELLFARLWKWTYAYQDRYWIPEERFVGPNKCETLLGRIKHLVKVYMGRRGWSSRNFQSHIASQALARIMAHCSAYARGYALLSDSYSRDVYLDILCYRILGPRHVRMPINTPEFWRRYNKAREYLVKKRTACVPNGSGQTIEINQYDIQGNTGLLHLHISQHGYRNWFQLHQYDYMHQGNRIGVEPGDVVIDGGGCWGDTAIYFADRAAPGGRVYTFEFAPENTTVLRMNIESNPKLADRIIPVENALSDVDGKQMEYSMSGPAARIGNTLSVTGPIVTASLDEWVRREQPGRVDFIKMDIEGSELSALHGSTKTLRQYRPKLAISAYHKPEDIYALAAYIDSLKLGYSFFMDHFSVHLEETVLFASCVTNKPTLHD